MPHRHEGCFCGKKCLEPVSLGHRANAQENHFYSFSKTHTQQGIVAVDRQVAPVLIEVQNICFSAGPSVFISTSLCLEAFSVRRPERVKIAQCYWETTASAEHLHPYSASMLGKQRFCPVSSLNCVNTNVGVLHPHIHQAVNELRFQCCKNKQSWEQFNVLVVSVSGSFHYIKT